MSTTHQVVASDLKQFQSAMGLADARHLVSSPCDLADWQQITNRASANYLVGDMSLALDLARTAVAIERNTSTLYNLAVILEAYGRFDEVRPLAEEIYAANPSNGQLSSILAESLLRDGDWRRGWPIYVQSYVLDTPLHLHIRRWTGHESLRGKRLLILQNGGIGDTFLFSRWFSRLANLGARITYVGPGSLTPLILAQGVVAAVIPTRGPDQIIDRINVRDYDYITTMMEIPGNLDVTLDDVLWRGPYITAPPTPELPRFSRPRVGISWQAGEYVYPRRRRSLSTAQRDRLLSVDTVEWINLQYEERVPAIHNPDVKGWSATASVVSQLDLVVSVDTAMAHLAGAMNIPVWVPLCGASAGLFLKSGDRLPYYPSMRLFRNLDLGLDHAVAAIHAALESFQC